MAPLRVWTVVGKRCRQGAPAASVRLPVGGGHDSPMKMHNFLLHDRGRAIKLQHFSRNIGAKEVWEASH